MNQIVINHYYPNSDPDIARRLGRIEKALIQETEVIKNMTATTDAAIARMTEAVQADTDVVASLEAFILANAQAAKDLAAEIAAEGGDASKLTALADAQIANSKRITALILANTPADPGLPVPDAVPSPDAASA